MNMDKKWYEIIIENWVQVAVLLGAIGFVIRSFTNYWLKKREISFSRLQENKILEIKAFYKSYHQLVLALRTYLYQTEMWEHTPDIFYKIKENIRERFIDFEYNVMTVKLFLQADDIVTIDEINSELESIRIDIGTWHIYENSNNPPAGWDKLKEIMEERLPKKLPELINKIETSLRHNLNLK